VDVVSPMLYPSHFVEPELKADPYGTVLRAMAHGKARVRAPLRPYLQAFSMAIPSGRSLPEHILAQIKAAEESGADGYLFWNPKPITPAFGRPRTWPKRNAGRKMEPKGAGCAGFS
jgi:hypothetical protein